MSNSADENIRSVEVQKSGEILPYKPQMPSVLILSFFVVGKESSVCTFQKIHLIVTRMSEVGKKWILRKLKAAQDNMALDWRHSKLCVITGFLVYL